MYTFDLPFFLYSENVRGELFPVSTTICFHISPVFLSNYRADRFFLWWLFLHRRLRSRQRGLFCFRKISDCALFDCTFQKVSSVFIRTTRRNFSISRPQSLSASIQGVNSNFFPSFVTLKSVRRRSVCLSLYRSKYRGIFDL